MEAPDPSESFSARTCFKSLSSSRRWLSFCDFCDASLRGFLRFLEAFFTPSKADAVRDKSSVVSIRKGRLPVLSKLKPSPQR